MTKFIDEQKEFQTCNKEELIEFLKTNNLPFTFKNIVDKIEILSIKNETLQKLIKGVDLGKGQYKYYYIQEDNTILELTNYFGWSGNGQPWTTENYIKIVKSDNINKYEFLTKEKLNINSFEKKLKELLNIPTLQNKKYENIEDLLLKNKKLFVKIFDKIFGKEIINTFFGDSEFLKKHLLFKKEINKRIKDKTSTNELKIKNLNNFLYEKRIIIKEIEL